MFWSYYKWQNILFGMDLKKHFNDVCAHFCAPFGQNMCAFVRFFEKFWCTHFCAHFGQNMCAFEFRIIRHSDGVPSLNKRRMKKKNSWPSDEIEKI